MLLSNDILTLTMDEERKMTITKDLQAIGKELTKLAKQTEKMATALEKAEKPKATSVKTMAKAKAVTKKAPVKAAKKTDTDKLLEIINRSKKGVDTATLMKKTGFNQKKVRNMLNRTYKQGKITRVEKGIYVGVK
jgi:predicted Rossmann fold nucleotide-binding protein DprA/Smf involved in DNA uptake